MDNKEDDVIVLKATDNLKLGDVYVDGSDLQTYQTFKSPIPTHLEFNVTFRDDENNLVGELKVVEGEVTFEGDFDLSAQKFCQFMQANINLVKATTQEELINAKQERDKALGAVKIARKLSAKDINDWLDDTDAHSDPKKSELVYFDNEIRQLFQWLVDRTLNNQ